MKIENINDYFLDRIINSIQKKRNLDRITFLKVRYGLQVLVYNIEKIAVILLLAIITSLQKEVVLILIPANIIKTSIYGVHAKNNTICTLYTLVVLFTGAIGIKRIEFIPTSIMIIFLVISLILIIKYAPADTSKFPLVNKDIRMRIKKRAIILFLLIIFFTNLLLQRNNQYYIIYGLFTQILMITPLAYKIFGDTYDNFKKYNKG